MADAPSQPEIDDVTDTSVHLVWSPPESDGGSKITKYVVEARKVKPEDEDGEVDEDWTDVAESPDCQCPVFNLDTGKDYEFRIRAVNELGPGDPSDASEKTKIELPKSNNCFLVIK